MDNSNLEVKLKARGQRLTKAKQSTLSFIASVNRPFSAQELISMLEQDGHAVNKTTVYRQLDALLADSVLQEVNLNDGLTRYELRQENCHHHIVCTTCGKVEHVELTSEIENLQQKLAKKSGFQIDEHMLEFFGKCAGCK